MSGQIVSDVQGVPSQVNNGRKPLSGLQKIGIIVLVSVVVLAFVMLRGSGTKTVHEKASPPVTAQDAGMEFRAPPVSAPLPAAAPMTTPPVVLPGKGTGLSLGRSQPDPEQVARDSDILNGAGGTGTAAGEGNASAMLEGDRSHSSDRTPLGQALKPTMLEGSKATLLPHPLMTITMGTQIPCTPIQPLTSDAPGMVTCTIPVDIFGQRVGPNRHGVALLPAGTRVVGTEQAMIQQGHNRLFVLWQRAQTPDNVIINMDSPAADEIGEAGLDGDLNTHFWQRFGGAIMLSFIDSGLQAAAQIASQTGGGSNSVNFSSFSSGGTSAAATALQSTVNIPPTLHRDQALPATVFVARDLDFSDVYGLQVAQ